MPGYHTSKKPYASNPHGGEHNYAGKTLLTGGRPEGEAKPTQSKKQKKAAPKKAVAVPSREELKAMTKVDLEKTMRKHGLELDRRKTKDALVRQSAAFLKGK